jgi:hypothetical protein
MKMQDQETIESAAKQAEMLAVAERLKAFVAWRNDLDGDLPFPDMWQLDRDLDAAVAYIKERQGK